MNKETIIQEAKSLFNTKTIILVIAVVAITYFIIPSKETIQYRNVPVRDDALITKITNEYEKKLKEKQSFIDKLLGQNKPSKPPTGTVGKPDKPPIEPTALPPDTIRTKDTVWVEKHAYAYDFPLSIEVTPRQVKVTTFNPFLMAINANNTKQYIYDGENEDFQLFATQTTDPNSLDGLKMTFDSRFFTFDGVWLCVGAGFPKQWYVSIDAEATFYQRLNVNAKLNSLPYAGVEARWRLFK